MTLPSTVWPAHWRTKEGGGQRATPSADAIDDRRFLGCAIAVVATDAGTSKHGDLRAHDLTEAHLPSWFRLTARVIELAEEPQRGRLFGLSFTPDARPSFVVVHEILTASGVAAYAN